MRDFAGDSGQIAAAVADTRIGKKGEHKEGERLRREHLFLNFRIYRGGRIEVRPSFHYELEPRFKSGRPRLTASSCVMRTTDRSKRSASS